MTEKKQHTTVVVGGGHAAGALLANLLQQKYQGKVVLVGEEHYPPYQRPPLSKAYLSGEAEHKSLLLKPLSAYEGAGFQMHLGVRVDSIDRASRCLSLSDQSTLSYDRLVLATGSKVRRLNATGIESKGIHYLHDIADADQLRQALAPGKRLVIVGGGYIGLEVAASSTKLGVKVTVLEAAERLMQRVTGPEVSAFLHEKHARAGVDVRLGSAVKGFKADGQGQVEGVMLGSGECVPADVVLISIGVVAAADLAEAAGIACEDGILVDENVRTNDPAILAIGDCTRHKNLFFEETQRLECVSNAVDQARIAAAILAGEDKPYESVPWFWSNQFDVRLQMVGLSEGHDQRVVRGCPDGETFAVFYLRDSNVVAVDAVNMPLAFMVGKKLVARRAKVEAQSLADIEYDIKSLT